MSTKSSVFPDCFKENEYGVSGSIDSCPECGSTDYKADEGESDNDLVDLKCKNCGQNYSLKKEYVEDDSHE